MISGREPITVPAGVDLSEGYASEAEFAALLSAALKAAPMARPAEDTSGTRSSDGRGSSGQG